MSVGWWTPTSKSTGIIVGIDQSDELDDLEGVGIDELDQWRLEQNMAGTPATAQQEADDEAESWGMHSGPAPKSSGCSCQMTWGGVA